MTDTIALTEDLQGIVDACHHDPFSVLGLQRDADHDRVTVFAPRAESMAVEAGARLALTRLDGTDLFQCTVVRGSLSGPYQLRWRDRAGSEHVSFDPYSFPPTLSEGDLRSFSAGSHRRAHRFLGAHQREICGVSGIVFAVWAPCATRVSVVGDFNDWDGRAHPMRSRGDSGVFELFIPDLIAGELYRFEIRTDAGALRLKSDPYAQASQVRPDSASVVAAPSVYEWRDGPWMDERKGHGWERAPLSIYEVHLGSWQRSTDGEFLDYATLADRLVPYVSKLGFTHIELMPITEHPLDASWGYQCTGFFAPTSRFGHADGLRYLIDRCHQAGIGVLLDWVPGHFPKDDHALRQFDGSALYEHADPLRAEHPDWGTLTFNYSRHEVVCFLLSSACYWLESFHFDGLRVDAVASMLYLDYSREEGQWTPNEHGGRENLEAIDFLRQLNECVHGEFPGAMVIAEESTAWPQVTRPTYIGGLGFSMKWSMGWMHDTLDYMALDPVHRQFHHDRLTFGMMYSHTENFLLPFSHDEVVHGKGSMLGKMSGDDWQRFANLRALYAYQYTYPGKKLLFMGAEHAQWREWDHDGTLDWRLANEPRHHGIARLVTDLNALHRTIPALYELDFDASGFEWIDCHDAQQSVLSFLRCDASGKTVVVVVNFTPLPRYDYRLGVPGIGTYREILNTDAEAYGGSGVGNMGAVDALNEPWMGRPASLIVTLPPLAAVVFLPA